MLMMRKKIEERGEMMNDQILSKRLTTVVNYIPKGARVADIGSDHAYLPCYIVKQSNVPFAIAGEVATGPYTSALTQVAHAGLTDKISVRKGNGLAVIEEGEVDCITIAGMGGSLIATILEEGKEKLTSVTRLVLQPNIGAHAIRKWLLANGWELVAEEIIEEHYQVYEILVAEKGDPYAPYGDELDSGILLGPFLQKKQHDAFLKKWKGEMKTWLHVLKQLDQAENSQEIFDKRQDIQRKIAIVKEAIKQ